MPSKYLRDDDRIVRYVPFGKMRRDENDVVNGVLGAALNLRSGEKYLSGNWCEYYTGASSESLRCAIEAFRNSGYDVRPKGHFVILPIEKVKSYFASRELKIRAIHHPEPENPCHAGLHRWPNDDFELLQRLADEEWISWCNRVEADDLPLTECAASAYGEQPA